MPALESAYACMNQTVNRLPRKFKCVHLNKLLLNKQKKKTKKGKQIEFRMENQTVTEVESTHSKPSSNTSPAKK